MNARRFLDCGSPRPPLCNSDKPDEMSVRPETRGRDGDCAEAAKRPPLRDAIPDLFSVRMHTELRERFTTKRLAGLTDLVRPHLETDQRIRTEGMGDGHVSRVAPLRD
jgi:hypothetical protein